MKFILGLIIGVNFGFVASACLKVASDYDRDAEQDAKAIEEFLERCEK